MVRSSSCASWGPIKEHTFTIGTGFLRGGQAQAPARGGGLAARLLDQHTRPPSASGTAVHSRDEQEEEVAQLGGVRARNELHGFVRCSHVGPRMA